MKLQDFLLFNTENTEFVQSELLNIKVAETISAFANSSGGKIFVGIDKKGNIKGVNPLIEEQMWFDNILNQIKNEVQYKIDKIAIKHLSYLVIEVYSVQHNVFFNYNGEVLLYIRNKEDNLIMPKIIQEFRSKKEYKVEQEDQLLVEKIIQSEFEVSLSKIFKLSPFNQTKTEQILIQLYKNSVINYLFKDSVLYMCKTL